jgi:hypothetical protein
MVLTETLLEMKRHIPFLESAALCKTISLGIGPG